MDFGRFEAFWASFEEDLKGGRASEMLKEMSGELEFEEMIDGLLKCRGPASKTDIIAIRRRFLRFRRLSERLKARLLVRMMTAVCEKLGIRDV